MLDYRNNLKTILNKTAGDDQSLTNSLAAIKAIIQMAEGDKESKPSQTPTKKPVKNHNVTEKTYVRQLLKSTAGLIRQPGDRNHQEKAVQAIHRLTFVPGVSKQYGDLLNSLEQAIKASQPTESAVNRKIFEEAVKPKATKRDYRKGKRYTVIRLLTGCDLVNENGDVVFNIKEAQIHSLNLKSGDVVEALPLADSHYEAEVLRVVGFKKLRTRDYDPIETFDYGVVQKNGKSFSVTRNIRGEHLKIRGKSTTVWLDESYYQGGLVPLEDGSIVDLAWYTGDIRLKKQPADAVRVRWIYETEQPKRPQPKKVKKIKAETNDSLEKLDLDLHYQRVGIAIGDHQNESFLESIVTRYHGIPIPIDAFEGKRKLMENQIKRLDLVILVTAFAAHDATWNINEFASKYGVKFAVSSSKGYQSFERALYRAEKGLPAYEGTQSIDYKKA